MKTMKKFKNVTLLIRALRKGEAICGSCPTPWKNVAVGRIIMHDRKCCTCKEK